VNPTTINPTTVNPSTANPTINPTIATPNPTTLAPTFNPTEFYNPQPFINNTLVPCKTEFNATFNNETGEIIYPPGCINCTTYHDDPANNADLPANPLPNTCYEGHRTYNAENACYIGNVDWTPHSHIQAGSIITIFGNVEAEKCNGGFTKNIDGQIQINAGGSFVWYTENGGCKEGTDVPPIIQCDLVTNSTI